MIKEKMLKLLILDTIADQISKSGVYHDYLNSNYDIEKLQSDYVSLGKEFLQEYALNKTSREE